MQCPWPDPARIQRNNLQSFSAAYKLDLNLINGMHVTLAPPEGWWIMTRALGSECLMPAVPAAKSKLPMLAAWPTHQVEMGFKMYCMVS